MSERRGPAEWTVQLLGATALRGPGAVRVPLERKTAALLAYVCLQGPTMRAHLARLLWPDSRDGTARNNLRQLLRRLREAAGGFSPLLTEEEPLRLAPGVDVDAAQLQLWVSSGRYAEAARMGGELLADHALEDCPELAGWLREQRLQLQQLRLQAAAEEAARLEREGQVRAALEWNRRVLEEDPTREEAHRRAMRLHAQLGDRAEALRAYDRCRLVLQRELGVAPHPETRALARQLERGAAPSPAPAPERQALPTAVLRPRVLAGRAGLVQRMHAAWDARQVMLVFGDPGTGKSRLVSEFVAARGEPVLLCPGRPADRAVAHSTNARLYRMLLAGRPDVELPAWVRAELSRIVPELGEAPAPLATETDRLRFFQAMVELVRRAGAGCAAIISDDLQYADAPSIEAAMYILDHLQQYPELPRFIACFRTQEVTAEMEAMVAGMVESGMAVRLDVGPLTEAEVADLLGGVDVPEAARLAGPLARYTGGNPLFVVETLKSLIEAGELGEALPERLPPPGRVGPLLAQRLSRLSLPALQLARCVAVAQASFSLELAAQVLGVSTQEATRAWEELATAQMVRERWFTHDLLYEAVDGALTGPVRQWLHRRVAEALEGARAGAGVVAYHWQQAGEPGRARALH